MSERARDLSTAETERSDVESRVREFLLARFPSASPQIERMRPDQHLWDVVDSLGLIELVEFVERAFSIRVEPIDFVPENFESLEQLSRFVVAQQRPR